MSSKNYGPQLAKLSERQRDILFYRCKGLVYKRIGEELHISLSVVKTNMKHIYAKLGIDQLPAMERNAILANEICPELSKQQDLSTELPKGISDSDIVLSHLPTMEKQEDDSILIFSRARKTIPYVLGSVLIALVFYLGYLLVNGFSTDKEALAGSQVETVATNSIVLPDFTVTPIREITLTVEKSFGDVLAEPTATPLPTTTPTVTYTATTMVSPRSTPSIATATNTPIKNDDFEEAIVISEFPYRIEFDLSNATLQEGEPRFCSINVPNINRSVWYKIVPEETVTLTGDIIFSDVEVAIIGYFGSDLNSLNKSGCISWAGPQNKVTFPFSFREGNTYYLQIGGLFPSTGTITIEEYQ
ncbi:MAG: helix-turn-helix transcriptional regulator [Anaerolineaceae bacterium]|nr:helix-turn-helix transcriptional regulator [Anaerolineaceae bacterium]